MTSFPPPLVSSLDAFFFVAVFRGYCLCLLEDLFFWHGKEFAGDNHNSSLNILKAFKQVGAF